MEKAIELLRRLVEAGCKHPLQYSGHECHYCHVDLEDEPHKPDCPYIAAKAFLGMT